MIADRFITSTLMTYVRCRGTLKLAIDQAKVRLMVAGSTLSLITLCVVIRLFDIAVLQSDESYAMDLMQKKGLQTARANIVDRNNQLLATTIVTGSLSANAKVVKDAAKIAERLSPIIAISKPALIKKLSSNRRFIWLARHLTPTQQKDVIKLGIPGLDIIRDERRVYPNGNLTSHIIGMTDIDNQGIAGIEKTQDHDLRTRLDDLKLSIDVRLQNVLFTSLEKSYHEFQAKAANGVIMDINSGEILAMVSFPDFNPNAPKSVDYKDVFDRNVSGVYELGSILKIMNTGLALEEANVSLDKQYDATKPLKIGRFSVTDFHGKNKWLSVSDIFRYSSNIGSGLMALEAGIDAQKGFMKKIGFTEAVDIELPGSAKPLYPKHWSEANTITISYGYGISLTPLQFAAATAGLLNGGYSIKPTLLKPDEDDTTTRIQKKLVSAKTSAALRALMRFTVTNGTAKKANVDGFVVLGKTGTAMQRVKGKYKHGVVTTSFVGTLGRTLNKPEYLVMVTFDQPKGTEKTWGYRTAGWNATPTAGEIMRKMVSVLGLEPAHKKQLESFENIGPLVKLASLKS